MGNIINHSVVRQCFSFISKRSIRFPLADRRIQKLTTERCIKLLVGAQLFKWESLREIACRLATSRPLQKIVGLSTISHSQISRRLQDLPTDLLENMLLTLTRKVHQEAGPAVKSNLNLSIIDSTYLQLPKQLSAWAHLGKKTTQMKVHMQVSALASGSCLPGRVIPSTANVSDSEVMGLLVQGQDGTVYIMDRGYIQYKQFDAWIQDKVSFVTRLTKRNGIREVVEEREIPENSRTTRDAVVRLGSDFVEMEHPVRLVEFTDTQGRHYRLVSSCLQLTAEEISDIYRRRWLIELYFKWIKQHLQLKKLFSYDPRGLWNQIFISLIAYSISMLIYIRSQTQLPHWELLRALRVCWEKDVRVMHQLLHPTMSKTSKGRQKRPKEEEKVTHFPVGVGIVKPVSSNKHPRRRDRKKKVK